MTHTFLSAPRLFAGSSVSKQCPGDNGIQLTVCGHSTDLATKPMRQCDDETIRQWYNEAMRQWYN